MSLFSTMRTSVSGMAAQSNALSTIGDNIANSGTTGYKDANAQFSTLLGQNSTGNYESGGVTTDVRYGITDQGTLQTTTSATDLAVSGNGFFVVSKPGSSADAATYLTRAGSFIPDSNGNLVNTAGYQLMGFPISSSGVQGSVMKPVNISSTNYQVASSTVGTLTVNVPAGASTVTTTLPSGNTAASTYTSKTSVTVYDNLGTTDVLDVYYTKTGANTWEMAVFQQSAASASGGFPYTSTAGSPQPMTYTSLTFNGSTGALTAPTSGSLSVPVPNGNTIKFDISGTTQLATTFGVGKATADGNAPSKLDHVAVGTDGTLTAVYASGVQIKTYSIPLGNVQSPNNLTPLSGNVYAVSNDSGSLITSTAGTNGLGTIKSDTLEQSTVDLATELTNMVQAQRAYEANSKVLQASSDLLGVLNRISTN